MLEGWLDFHRATLAIKCEGLSDTQLRTRSVPPSAMSLIGLVRHMADVERFWFREVMAGEEAPPIYWDNPGHDSDFDDVDGADPAADFAIWRGECERARTVAGGLSLDAVGTERVTDPDGTLRELPITLRWVLSHMIEEYARHNGHADLLRETIDGTTGE